MGLKEIDAVKTMPLLGSQLLKVSNNEDTDSDGFLSVQSAFLCFPILAQVGPESKEVVQKVFKKKYDALMSTTKADCNGRNKWFPEWKRFELHCPSDQKFAWMGTAAGGAAKVK